MLPSRFCCRIWRHPVPRGSRFRREGQAAAAVIDNHVLPIYAVDQRQGTPYLVMQYTRGVTCRCAIIAKRTNSIRSGLVLQSRKRSIETIAWMGDLGSTSLVSANRPTAVTLFIVLAAGVSDDGATPGATVNQSLVKLMTEHLSLFAFNGLRPRRQKDGANLNRYQSVAP